MADQNRTVFLQDVLSEVRQEASCSEMSMSEQSSRILSIHFFFDSRGIEDLYSPQSGRKKTNEINQQARYDSTNFRRDL